MEIAGKNVLEWYDEQAFAQVATTTKAARLCVLTNLRMNRNLVNDDNSASVHRHGRRRREDGTAEVRHWALRSVRGVC